MNSWILPDLASALSLGFYDASKKAAVRSNNVVLVLFFTTLLCALFSPVLLACTGQLASSWRCDLPTYFLIWIKSLIVGGSWYFGYLALDMLPLSIWTPIRATAPLWTFIGGLIFFHEVPTFWKGIGMLSIFAGYYILSVWGNREGFTLKDSPGCATAFSARCWVPSAPPMTNTCSMCSRYPRAPFSSTSASIWPSFFWPSSLSSGADACGRRSPGAGPSFPRPCFF